MFVNALLHVLSLLLTLSGHLEYYASNIPAICASLVHNCSTTHCCSRWNTRLHSLPAARSRTCWGSHYLHVPCSRTAEERSANVRHSPCFGFAREARGKGEGDDAYTGLSARSPRCLPLILVSKSVIRCMRSRYAAVLEPRGHGTAAIGSPTRIRAWELLRKPLLRRPRGGDQGGGGVGSRPLLE